MKLEKALNKLILILIIFSACNQHNVIIPEEQPTKVEEPIVELYSTDWCYWCHEAETFLEDNEIKYIRYDFEDTDSYKKLTETAKRIGYKDRINSIPVFVIGNKIIVGYDPVEIIYTLGRSGAVVKTFFRNSSTVL